MVSERNRLIEEKEKLLVQLLSDEIQKRISEEVCAQIVGTLRETEEKNLMHDIFKRFL